MKINWKVRMKNPAFWAAVVISVFTPILAYFGFVWEDMTTWGKIGELLLQAVQNPVVVLSVLANLWATVNDPTTKGLGDSTRALGYTSPYSDKKGM